MLLVEAGSESELDRSAVYVSSEYQHAVTRVKLVEDIVLGL